MSKDNKLLSGDEYESTIKEYAADVFIFIVWNLLILINKVLPKKHKDKHL